MSEFLLPKRHSVESITLEDRAIRIVNIVELAFHVGLNTQAHASACEKVLDELETFLAVKRTQDIQKQIEHRNASSKHGEKYSRTQRLPRWSKL